MEEDEMPVLDNLEEDYNNHVKMETDAIEDRAFAYEQVKKKEKELKAAKSALYKASKFLKGARLDKRKTSNRWKTYTYRKRAWAKKNMGRVIEELGEEQND